MDPIRGDHDRAGSRRVTATAHASVPSDASAKQGAVSRLVQVYANRGHLLADIDPLGLMQRPVPEVHSMANDSGPKSAAKGVVEGIKGKARGSSVA